MDDATWAAFEKLYGALPRQGPGDEAATLAALEMVPELPDEAKVVDAGCGSGTSTFVLAEALSGAHFLAVDTLPGLLERLEAEARKRGVADRIETRCGSMLELDERELDLIWCEGAIYNVGVETALRAWAPCLRSGGVVMFSEACWFVEPEQRDQEVVNFWASEYPQIDDEAGVRRRVQALGDYEVLGERRLPRQVWMDSYYTPLAARCEALRSGADEVMLEVIAMAQREMDIFRRFGDLYGYSYFVARRV
jgi:serine/threonine-protein kinase HipA